MATTTPIPYTPPYQKISDRKINVAMKIGNRQDLMQPAPNSGFNYSRISGWLRDAYITTGMSRKFEQSQLSVTFQTVRGQDTYALPSQVRAFEALTGYDNQNTPIILDYKNLAYLRRYNPGNIPTGNQFQMFSRPSIFTFYGASIIFRPVPDQSYTFILDFWQKPLISKDVDSTQLWVPDDWLEVVDYEAAIRGNAELQQADKSQEMQKLLYGYTDSQTQSKVQGLIERLQNRDQAQAPSVDYGLQPSYSGGYTR